MNMMTKIATFAGFAAGLQLAAAGDITGSITLKGTPPAEKEITQLKDDVNCGKLHTEAVKTRFYVVGGQGELADVFVTLKGISGKSTGASAPPLVIDQKGCEYTPYVAACQTGQKIVVKNSDPVLHNVHATPANTAAGNKEDNKAQMAGGPDLNFVFPAPENFLRFKCDVHPWMFSYINVVDHPYFAVTGKDGKFTIKNVPAGKYTLVAMHRKAAPAPAGVEKEIEVTADGAKVDLTLDAK
jgi:plastocyanin